MGERVGVSAEEWAQIGPLLPPEHNRGCRPSGDNRRYFEGMMWMARSGAQWRLLPDDYGKWNSVFRRYRRWVETSGFDALLETLAEIVERDTSVDMIDSTMIRAHHWAVGLKKRDQEAQGLGRLRGGFTTKCHARCDGHGRPLGFVLTPGQAHDLKGFDPLFGMLSDRIDALLADKGYEVDAIRAELAAAGVEAVIPTKSNRRIPIPHGRVKYRWRNLVERLFSKLKNWRRVATRYDKTKESYLGFVTLASIKLWLPEPRRVYRRRWVVSHAAISMLSAAA